MTMMMHLRVFLLVILAGLETWTRKNVYNYVQSTLHNFLITFTQKIALANAQTVIMLTLRQR